MTQPKVIQRNDPEYKNLEFAAAAANLLSPKGYTYRVGDTYFDYGQNWKWTTLLVDDGGNWGGYQALNPREFEAIVEAETPEQILEIVREMFKDKFCPDREN